MTVKNRRMFELRLGKLGLILFVCGMAGLLFSVFLLGIVVGKHMDAYPERSFPGIPELIRENLFASRAKGGKVPPPAEQGARSESGGGEDRFDLTFYETLGGKKGPEEQTANGEKAGEGVVKKQKQLPGRTAQTEEKKPKTLPASEETASPEKGRFELQAAAYREKGKAEQMAQRIAALGFSARVASKELPAKGLWYRVIVDGFQSRAKAQEAADSLAGKIGGLKGVVRPAGRNGNGD